MVWRTRLCSAHPIAEDGYQPAPLCLEQVSEPACTYAANTDVHSPPTRHRIHAGKMPQSRYNIQDRAFKAIDYFICIFKFINKPQNNTFNKYKYLNKHQIEKYLHLLIHI